MYLQLFPSLHQPISQPDAFALICWCEATGGQKGQYTLEQVPSDTISQRQLGDLFSYIHYTQLRRLFLFLLAMLPPIDIITWSH